MSVDQVFHAVATSYSGAYSEPCQTSKMELFCEKHPESCQIFSCRAPSYMFNRLLNTPLLLINECLNLLESRLNFAS